MSRPIPIKSPRELNSGSGSRTSRISQSLPVPASPYFGSLKAPPEFLSGMPPLTLPQSYQENELINKQKDTMAKSAPASDLIPLHQYRIEDKRNKSKHSDVGVKLVNKADLYSHQPTHEYSHEAASSELASSVILRMQGLRIDEEGEDTASPHLEAAAFEVTDSSKDEGGKGLLLSKIQRGESTEVQEAEVLVSHGIDDEDDEELQFELS